MRSTIAWNIDTVTHNSIHYTIRDILLDGISPPPR